MGSQAPTQIPAWLAGLSSTGLGSVLRATRLAWGFRNESWKVVLANGRVLAITRLADEASAEAIIAKTALINPRLLAAGVRVPVIDLEIAWTPGLLVTDFVPGTPGADLLGEPGGAALVGSLLGSTWRQLATVDITDALLPGWGDPSRLAQVSMERLRAVPLSLGATEQRQLAADLSALPGLLHDRPLGFVHGDLVPVNVIVGADGALAALLDLEDARVADPLLDAGWFDLIVAFHHPRSEPAAWAAFLSAAALDDRDPITEALLRILPEVRLLEILDRSSARDASHWTALLRSCLARMHSPSSRKLVDTPATPTEIRRPHRSRP